MNRDEIMLKHCYSFLAECEDWMRAGSVRCASFWLSRACEAHNAMPSLEAKLANMPRMAEARKFYECLLDRMQVEWRKSLDDDEEG
jgi:hypothetical protein